DRDENAVPEIRSEGELAENLGVVLRCEPEFPHRLAVADVDLEFLIRRLGVDERCLEADAAEFRQFARRAVRQGYAVERERMLLSRHGDRFLSVRQELRRKLVQRGGALERRQ